MLHRTTSAALAATALVLGACAGGDGQRVVERAGTLEVRPQQHAHASRIINMTRALSEGRPRPVKPVPAAAPRRQRRRGGRRGLDSPRRSARLRSIPHR